MLGKFDSKYNILGEDAEKHPWNPKAITLEVFTIFEDKDLFEESFSQSKRQKIKSKNPEEKMVTYIRIRHPLITENLYEFKYQSKVPFEQALKRLEKEKDRIVRTAKSIGPELSKKERKRTVTKGKKRGRGKMKSQEFK